MCSYYEHVMELKRLANFFMIKHKHTHILILMKTFMFHGNRFLAPHSDIIIITK